MAIFFVGILKKKIFNCTLHKIFLFKLVFMFLILMWIQYCMIMSLDLNSKRLIFCCHHCIHEILCQCQFSYDFHKIISGKTSKKMHLKAFFFSWTGGICHVNSWSQNKYHMRCISKVYSLHELIQIWRNIRTNSKNADFWKNCPPVFDQIGRCIWLLHAHQTFSRIVWFYHISHWIFKLKDFFNLSPHFGLWNFCLVLVKFEVQA